LVVLWGLALAACGRGNSSPASESTATTSEALSVGSVTVSPPNASFPPTVQQQFSATVVMSNHKKSALTGATWSVSDPTVATVSSSGLVTALKAGTASVTATDSSSGVSGSATVTVTAATLVSVAVTPTTKKLAVGATQAFKATGTFSDGSTYPLGAPIWSSSDAAVATVSSGTATGVAPGSVTIKATDSTTGLSAQAFLTVGTGTLTSVTVTPATVSLPKGLMESFTATANYSDGSTSDVTTSVTWSSSNTNVATISNASGSAGVTAAVNVGTSTITATFNGKTSTATLTTTAAVLRSIAISPASKNLPKGVTQQLIATGTYSDNTVQDLTAVVTWSSSSPAVFISNAAGTYGLAYALALGTATITATDPSTGIPATASLTVTSAALASLTITPPAASVALGYGQLFHAIGTFTDSTTQDLTASVAWTATPASAAAVSNAAGSQGLAASLSVGTASISAVDVSSGVAAPNASLTVTPAVLTALSLNPPAASIANGLTQQFTVTGTFSDGSHQDLTSVESWSVTSGTATVSNAAGSAGLAASNGVGTSTLQATDATTGLRATATLNVTAAVLTSIGVTPAVPNIPLGTTQQFVATGVFSDRTTQDMTALVTWTSSNADATVSNVAGTNGLARAAAAGTTTITATYAPTGVGGSTTLTVTPAALVSIAITPPSLGLPAGYVQQFAATGTYSDQSTQDLTITSTWTSSAPALFSVSNLGGSVGLGTAISPGTVTLTATDPATGITGTTTVTVTQALLVSIALSPSMASLPLGTSQQLAATGTYSDRSKHDITSSVTWTSSTGAASVSNATGSAGLVTTLGNGSALVTATDPASGITASATISVTAAALLSIDVSPTAQSVPKGLTQQFSAKGTYTDGSTQDLTPSVTWSSSGSSATISNAAGSAGLATALSLGTATITALDPATGVSGTAMMTTTAAVLQSIDVTPPAPSTPVGLTVQMVATGLYSDGSQLDVTGAVTWTSSASSASVSNASGSAGLVTGIQIGTANVTATDPATGIAGAASVAVTAAVPVKVSVTPVSSNLLTGQTQQMTATVTMSDGSQVDETKAVVWASSNASVYVASSSVAYGQVTGVSIGSATVTATDSASGLTASATISVSLRTSDSAAQEFSPYVNPVGNWSFGALRPGPFELATTSEQIAGNDVWLAGSSDAQILHNGTGATTQWEYGTVSYLSEGYTGYFYTTSWSDYAASLPPGGLALQPLNEAAAARWAAPSAGIYTIAATFTGQSYVGTASGTCVFYDWCCQASCHSWCFLSCCSGAYYCDYNSFYTCGTYSSSCTTEVTQTTTTDVSVLRNGTPLFSNFVNLNGAGNQQTFTTTVALQAGDTIDFVVGNGGDGTTGTDGRYKDTTLLDAQITGGATCASLNQPGPGKLVDLKLSPSGANVTGAGSTAFQALAYYANQPTNAVDVTAQAAWTASGSDLAVSGGSVSYSGLVFAPGSVGATFGGLSASAPVRVWDPNQVSRMQSLTLTSAALSGSIWYATQGQCTTVTATANYSDGTVEDVTGNTIWSGFEPVLFGNVLVINAPRSQYIDLNATLGAGFPSATQLLYVGDPSVYSGTCNDSRIPGPAWKVYVSPSSGSMYVGQTASLNASAYFADGSTRDVSARTAWVSCNASVVDAAPDGWITGVAAGSTSVLGAVGSMGGGASFSVAAGPQPGHLTSLFVVPSGNNLVTGASAPAHAIATYDNMPGVIYNVTPQATWSSSNSSVVSVPSSVTGATVTTTATGLGTAKVIASFGGWNNAQTFKDWAPARLAQLTSTAVAIDEFPSCTGAQATLTASFSDGTTEDVTASAQWSNEGYSGGGPWGPLGDSGYAFLSETGYVSPLGHRQSYLGVMGSLGVGLDMPRSAPVGIFGTCSGPTCSDGVKDGFETDVDCGGPECAPCGATLACLAGTDCASGTCLQLVCQ
jgi:uncharacterized protein YjdB